MTYAYCSYRDVKQRTTASPYYFATDHLHDDKTIKKYIECINTKKLVEIALQQDDHLYEILTNLNRKLYIDVDKIEWSLTVLYDNIQKLLTLLYKLLSVKINIDDVIVLTNDPIDGVYSSVHLIVNISMTYTDQKCLTEYINATTDFVLDTKVYTAYRLFRCMNQSKLNKTPMRLLSKHTILDTLVNITDHLPIYTFNQVYTPPMTRTMTEVKTPTDMIEHFLITKDPALFEKNTKKIWSSITKIIHQYPEIYNLDEWLKQSSELSSYSYDQNKTYVDALNMDFEYEDENYVYVIANTILEGDIHYIKPFMTSRVLEEHLLQYFPSTLLDTILECIYERTVLSEYKGKKFYKRTFYYNEEDYDVNTKTGFITSKSFIQNYHYDLIEPTELPTIIRLNTIQDARERLECFMENDSKLFVLKSAWGTGKTQHCLKRIVELYSTYRILLITSVNSLNLTMTTQLNQYIQELYDGKATPEQLFYSHLDTQKDKTIQLKQCTKVVCSIQSLCKIDNTAFDIIFIDEFESVMNAYYAHQTFKHQSIQSLYHTMTNIVNISGKVVVLDADISQDKLELIQTILGQPKTEIYKNNQLSFRGVEYEIHNCELECYLLMLIEEQLNDVKLVIPCASRKNALYVLYVLTNTMSENNELKKINEKYATLVKDYYDKIKHKTILYIDRDGVKLYKTNGVFHDYSIYTNNDVYVNLDAFIQLHNVDVFIYTPTITTGLSINESYFDKSYAIACHLSVNYKEFIQMMMRTRKLNHNQSNILIHSTQFKAYQSQTTMKQILSSQIHRAKLINGIIYSKDEREYTDATVVNEIMMELEQMNNNDIELLTTQSYCKCQLINMLNLKHTKDNFVFNFITVLKYHQLSYHYTQRRSTLVGYVDMEANKEAQYTNDFNQWNAVPILSYGDYTRVRLQNYFKDKPIPVVYDLMLYLEEPTEDPTIKSMYWKTHTLFNLLKVYAFHIPCITQITEYFENGIDVNTLTHIHTILTSSNITADVDVAFQDVWNTYKHDMVWKIYIQDNQYNKVYALRRFMKKPITLESIKTYTDKDAIKMDLSILKTISDIFHIDLHHPTEITLTNTQLWKNMATLHERIPTIYKYLKNIDFTISPTNATFRKEMYNYIKHQLKEHLDWTIYYQKDKNTTRPSDKLQLEPRRTWMDYNLPKEVLPPTFHARNPHLLELQPKPIPLNKVIVVDTTKEASLIILLEKGKYIPNTDKLALYKTMLMNAYAEYVLKYSRLDYVEKLMSETYFHHPHITMTTTESKYDHTYYTPSRNKKTITIPVSHSTVSHFIPQDNHYVKTEDKLITRPYAYTEKVIPTLHRPNGSFLDNFVADMLNECICCLELEQELKQIHEKKTLKSLVEV